MLTLTSTSNMKKLVVVGCSVSSGMGWDADQKNSDCKSAAELWVNICHRNIDQFADLELCNLSFAGATNFEIFTTAIDAVVNLTNDKSLIKFLLCQWTKLSRYKLDFGLELYPTNVVTGHALLSQSITTNQINIDKNWINRQCQTVLSLLHPHHQIVTLLHYVNTINQLAAKFNIQVYHINAKCPWDNNYFQFTDHSDWKPSDLTPYTQEHILFSHNRQDHETVLLYKKMFEQYNKVGGINEACWINLYDPWHHPKNLVDFNHDNVHAGKQSNLNFFQSVKQKLSC